MPLTPERMLELGRAHEAIEFSRDLDATMETLVERPVYLWFPLRLRIEGREAVRGMYKCMFPVMDQMQATIEQRRHFFTAFGKNQVMSEMEFPYRFKDGRTKPVRVATFFRFEGERLVGETVYCDGDFAKVLEELFEAEFRKLPGVSVI